MADSAQRKDRTTDRIERILRDHALTHTVFLAGKHEEADVCRCGTRHPQHDTGRWPTHTRHLAEQIAAVATLREGM